MSADRKKALYDEAIQLIQVGKYGQASKTIKELMALEPSNIEFRRLSASLNLKLGNMISARVVYDALVQEAMQMRDFRLAESLLKEYLAAGPRYLPFLELLGRVYEESDKPLLAANEYAKVLQILLEDADPGEAAHAADLHAKIKALSPNNPVLALYDAARFSQGASAAAPTPLETALKMSEPVPPPVSPPPAAHPVLPSAPTPPPAPPPPAVQPVSPSAPVLPPRPAAEDIPLVEDDLTDILAAASRPQARPVAPVREVPPSPPPPPLVEDDLTEILSRPIPKRPPLPTREVPPPPPPAPAPEEKPSLTKALFGFLYPSSAPEAAPPPPPAEEAPPVPSSVPTSGDSLPPAAPAEAAPTAPPQWKPWEPEEAAPPAPEPAAAEPALLQGTEWKPWQPPESEALQPAPDRPAPSQVTSAARLGTSPEFLVVDSRKGTGASPPSLDSAFGQRAPIPLRDRAAATPRSRLTTVRRTSRLAKAIKTLVTVVAIVVGLAATALGALVIGCLLLEQSPSDAFRNLTSAPAPLVQNPRKNASLLLLGFDAEAGRDPMAEGYERLQKPVSAQAIQCAWEQAPSSTVRFPAEVAGVETWWQGPDPVGQFQNEASRIQEWAAASQVLLGRYRQWLEMPFEDGGYGTFAVPNCVLILTAHRLYVAEGFAQGLDKGIARLEQDLKAWRAVLPLARTLPMKQLAFAIFNDDLTLLAGVFSRPDVSGDTVSDLVQLTKPLEQVERSLRWSMQNALAVDTKVFASGALFDAVPDPSPLVRLLAWLPLPKQRTLNAYAEHFEALLKAADQPLTKPPSLYEFARTPARTVMDYVTNPLDNLLPSRTVVAWDQQIGLVFDTEARLRLVGLSALLRGASRKAIPGRIAEAGSKYTDPFTELPMLLNPARGVIYSIGHNHRDDDGDPKLDVTIAWPFTEPARETPRGRR